MGAVCACAEMDDDDLFAPPLAGPLTQPRAGSLSSPSEKLDSEIAEANFIRSVTLTPEEHSALQNEAYDPTKVVTII